MAKDYDPNKTPPQWVTNMALNEGVLNDPYQALVRRIWRTEEPPVDPMLAVVREAIARGSDAVNGYGGHSIRATKYDNGVVAAVSYLREVGALVDKLQ